MSLKIVSPNIVYLGSAKAPSGGGVPVPIIVTNATATNMALKANTIYEWTAPLTELTIASIEKSHYETILYFDTGNQIIFQDFSALKWGGDGSAPSLEINTKYCISIRNGLAEFDTFGNV